MNTDLMIRPIRADEVVEAQRLVYTVAHTLMAPHQSLDEFTAQWIVWDILGDMRDMKTTYFENDGVFLVTVDGKQIVGTGAFHRDAARAGVCEVRRIALLPEYRGQGLGYALMLELVRRAREMGYRTMSLWTNRDKLVRAVNFYRQMGFVEVSHPGADADEIWMELALDPLV